MGRRGRGHERGRDWKGSRRRRGRRGGRGGKKRRRRGEQREEGEEEEKKKGWGRRGWQFGERRRGKEFQKGPGAICSPGQLQGSCLRSHQGPSSHSLSFCFSAFPRPHTTRRFHHERPGASAPPLPLLHLPPGQLISHLDGCLPPPAPASASSLSFPS